jgi:hypothetical protein
VKGAKGTGAHKDKNKAACTELADIRSLPAASVTPAEYHKLIRDLRHAKDEKLKIDAKAVARDVKAGDTAKITEAIARVKATCAALGIS